MATRSAAASAFVGSAVRIDVATGCVVALVWVRLFLARGGWRVARRFTAFVHNFRVIVVAVVVAGRAVSHISTKEQLVCVRTMRRAGRGGVVVVASYRSAAATPNLYIPQAQREREKKKRERG